MKFSQLKSVNFRNWEPEIVFCYFYLIWHKRTTVAHPDSAASKKFGGGMNSYHYGARRITYFPVLPIKISEYSLPFWNGNCLGSVTHSIPFSLNLSGSIQCWFFLKICIIFLTRQSKIWAAEILFKVNKYISYLDFLL